MDRPKEIIQMNKKTNQMFIVLANGGKNREWRRDDYLFCQSVKKTNKTKQTKKPDKDKEIQAQKSKQADKKRKDKKGKRKH